MKLYKTTDASRPSSIFLTTSYTQPYTYWYVLTASSSLECSFIKKKKDVIKWKFFVQLSNSHAFDRSKKLLLEKKRKDFHAKRHTFFEERARASEYTYTQK